MRRRLANRLVINENQYFFNKKAAPDNRGRTKKEH